MGPNDGFHSEGESEDDLDSNERSSPLNTMNDSVPPEGTNDIYEEKAMLLIEQLIDRGVFHLDDSEPLLYHEPSGQVFASVVNAAHFYAGWKAASNN